MLPDALSAMGARCPFHPKPRRLASAATGDPWIQDLTRSRQLRQRAIGLTDGQSDVVTMAIAPGNNNRFAVTGMKSVTDNRLTRLIAGIMKLLRPHQEFP